MSRSPPARGFIGRNARAAFISTSVLGIRRNLPMISEFITAHPPANPGLPTVRYALKQFMEEQPPSNFSKERWAASYNPARKVTYVSWFLGTIVDFLDRMDFTSLVSPPVETKFPVFIAEPPSAPLDPAPPQCNRAPVTSSSSAASRNSGQSIAPAAPAAKPVRQSRLWHAGGSAGLAALEARDAAERQAQLHHTPGEGAAERPAPSWATSEDVIHLRLPAPERPARDWATSDDVIHLHLGA
jgi:hypothetical protein